MRSRGVRGATLGLGDRDVDRVCTFRALRPRDGGEVTKADSWCMSYDSEEIDDAVFVLIMESVNAEFRCEFLDTLRLVLLILVDIDMDRSEMTEARDLDRLARDVDRLLAASNECMELVPDPAGEPEESVLRRDKDREADWWTS